MTELKSVEGISGMFDEIKSLVSDVKYGMMSGEDCNNQFYSVLQALDNISTSLKNIENDSSQPSDEYAIIQTNLLEVKKELATMNQNIDEVINHDLKDMLSKMTEKVNRLEILTNNAGIDQQIIKNITGEVEKNISSTLKETTDVLHSQSVSASNDLKKDIDEVNSNLKECVSYIEKAVSAVSEDAVNNLSDDISLVGKTIEKTSDNLKRSIIDLFTRIQEDIAKITLSEAAPQTQKSEAPDMTPIAKEIDELKTGISNLGSISDQKISQINQVIEDMDLFHKLENFSRLKDLPAIGDLKSSLKNSIDSLVEEYSVNIQREQTHEGVAQLAKDFRADVYNSLLSLLGHASEFLVEADNTQMSKTPIEDLSDKIDELSSVTELNSSGYNNIQIVLKDVSEKCEQISEAIKEYSKNSKMKSGSLEDYLMEIKNSLTEMKKGSLESYLTEIKDSVSELKNDSLEDYLTEINNSVSEIYTSASKIKEQNVELGNVIRECTSNVIEGSEPDRHLIKDMLSDIRKNISILQSGDEESEYTYSMQDIESDIAKIRIYLNELTQKGVSVNSEEFREELDGVVVMVDSMKQQMNKMDECNLSETLSNVKEDLMSVSTRVNKLLLSSDNSYNMINGALNEFKVLSEEIETELKNATDTNKFKNIEDDLMSIKVALSEGNNYSSVINQSLIMLAEWVDNAGETITSISEKQDKHESIDEIKMLLNGVLTSIGKSSDTVVDSVKSMLDDTNMLINTLKPFDYSDNLKVLDEKLTQQSNLIERQELRLNKLDEKLSTILEFIAKNDTGDLSSRMTEIDLKMERLNRSIERLTAYVNED